MVDYGCIYTYRCMYTCLCMHVERGFICTCIHVDQTNPWANMGIHTHVYMYVCVNVYLCIDGKFTYNYTYTCL